MPIFLFNRLFTGAVLHADLHTLIVTELSRLGRSTAEVITLINALVSRKIRVLICKQNLDIKQHDMNSKIMITLFSLFSELERDLISLRTKEALASKKAQGIKLGKPKGTLQRSKFDKDIEKIQELSGHDPYTDSRSNYPSSSWS